jgi:hypothetical protein
VVQDARWMGLESARWLSRLTSGVQDTPPVMQMMRRTRFEINHTSCPPPAKAVRVLPDGVRLPVEAPAAPSPVRIPAAAAGEVSMKGTAVR